MHHAARLRLVVNNSSSESSTPCSRDRRSRGKCHSPGMVSRTDHIPIALRDASGSSAANSAAPPKRPTISETEIGSVSVASIKTELATYCGQSQHPSVAVPKNTHGPHRVDHCRLPRDRMIMGGKSTNNVTPATRKMMGRLENLRTGKTNVPPFDDTETNQTNFAKGFGAKKTAYGRWERNEVAPPIWAVINFAVAYNLSLDYLMRGLGKPQPPHVFPSPTGDAVPPKPAKAVSRKTERKKTG